MKVRIVILVYKKCNNFFN